MRVVVDTNVWVSGLIQPGGAPGRVLDAILERRLEPVVSWALAEELVDVLRRPAIRRYGVTEADIEAILAVFGPFLPDADIAVPIRDPDDAPVIAAAVAGRAEAIITGDLDILDDPLLIAWLAARGIAVLSPVDAIAATS